MEAIEARRVASSSDLLNPGEYVFIPKREPKVTVMRIPVDAPKGFFARVFGRRRYELKKTAESIWPDVDTVVVNCPHCGQPVGTTKEHRIESVEPLTIDRPVACAYSRGANSTDMPTVAFSVKEGKITPA